MNDRDNRQAFRTEPRIEPVIGAGGASHASALSAEPTAEPTAESPPDYPEAGDMPAWLRETQPQASLVERYGRAALMWGAALLALTAMAVGAMWLRTEQKAHSELDAIAMSSRAADAAVIAAAPPAPVVPERRDVKVPPMVTLTPDGSAVLSAPAQDAVPATLQAVPAPPAPAPVVADAAPTVVKPARRAAPARALVAKAPVKAAPKARRTLAAAPWPPAPSRKLPLAQNVLPKVKMKAAAGARVKVAKAAPNKRLAAVKPKAQPRKVATMTLPPSKPRPVLLPPAREYPRDPVPIPRSCAKGELARDCAN